MVSVPEPERFRSAAYTEIVSENISEQSCVFVGDTLQQMASVTVKGYPNEVCGLLVGVVSDSGWEIKGVHQVENLNKDRAADRFELDPLGYQKVDRLVRGTGQEIVGVFHSHPDCPARPSPTDLQSAWEGFVYPIVSVCEGEVAEVHCWCLTGDIHEGGVFQKLPHSE